MSRNTERFAGLRPTCFQAAASLSSLAPTIFSSVYWNRRFHKLWASETHNPLENRPRYRIGHSFESFPFPLGFTPDMPIADVMAHPLAVTIADEARALYAAREAALASGPHPLDMTELYDLRDQGGAAWLTTAHRRLDVAVAAAYGWSSDLSDDAILAALGALHQTRQGNPIAENNEPADDLDTEGAISSTVPRC